MRSFVLALALVALFGAASARAQDAAGESRAHFARGVTLYDEGRLPQALAEFREAQHLSPSSVVLYNIAQVEAELGHAVESVAAYEELIATARTIEGSMRTQIDTALVEQRARIATLRVLTNAPGALIALDDVEIGTAPLDAVRVSAGEHVVSARANGYETLRYRFLVAGGATHDANLTLTLSGAAVGSLRVESRVPGVEVVVDGISYGLTPLGSAIALPSGAHHVEGRRVAYSLFAQDVTVAPGSESRATLVVEPDPAAPDSELGTLHLAMPAASSALRIDGSVADATSAARMSLPAGLHDIDVRVADREPFSVRVNLLATERYDLIPPYVWTPEARERQIRDSRSQQELGWGLLIGGGAVGIAGLITTIAVWADYEGGTANVANAFRDHCAGYNLFWSQPDHTMRDACVAALGTTTRPIRLTMMPNDLDAIARDLPRQLDAYYAELGVGIALSVIGGISLVTGIVLVATAPSEEAIDRGARASTFRLELAGGPSSLSLRGVF